MAYAIKGKRPFIPVYPHEEAHRGISFASTPEAVNNFIEKNVLRNFSRSYSKASSKKMQSKDFQIVTVCFAFRNRFRVTCLQVSRILKKRIKNHTSLPWVISQSRFQLVIEKITPFKLMRWVRHTRSCIDFAPIIKKTLHIGGLSSYT